MASELRLDLLNNASVTSGVGKWQGGRGTLFVDGTFGGATLTLQAKQPISGTWLTVGTEVTLTAAGLANFELPPCDLQILVAGGTASGLYATIVGTRVS